MRSALHSRAIAVSAAAVRGPIRAVHPSGRRQLHLSSPSASSAAASLSSHSPSPGRSLALFDYSAALRPLAGSLAGAGLSESPSALPRRVRLVEVGPRDGLQNERGAVSTADKVALVDALSGCGLAAIEVGSFVSPRWVPAMADSLAVFRAIRRHSGVSYAALTPNVQGLERALEAEASEVAVFASASESFSQANLNCSVADSLRRFEPLIDTARKRGLPVRGYVSCVIGCPYEGFIEPSAVLHVTKWLLNAGCYEVSLGDTIGIGQGSHQIDRSPALLCPRSSRQGRVSTLLRHLLSGGVAVSSLAVHFHDTYGQALANILESLHFGVAVVDSSISGLGGCPYAAGATGNVATEDVVYMLHGCGVDTGVDLRALVSVSDWVSKKLDRATQGRVTAALRNQICR